MYRVAILGYRHQGKLHHAPAFARHPDCEIVAVCDIVEERAREGAETYGVPWYTDVDKMLDGEDVDIVDIPVGERYRFDLVMKCLRRDKHVFTEKPLAGEAGQYLIRPCDVQTARAMIDEWLKHDVQFGVCFGNHGSPNVRRAKDVIRSGILGSFRMLCIRSAMGPWNHMIDLARYLGGEVSEVFAYADDVDKIKDKVVVLKYENGGVATLAVCAKLSLQFQAKWIGDKGEITIDNIAGTTEWRLHDSLEITRWTDETALDRSSYQTLYDGVIADFVESINKGCPFDADGWAGLRHIEIDAAVTQSIESHQPVHVERYMPEKGRTVFS